LQFAIRQEQDMANSIPIPGTAAATAAPARPYAPSWVDRLTGWIDRRPGAPWVFYAGLAASLVALETAVKFADGTYPARFHHWHLILALTGVYFLGLVHWLDRAAARALAAFHPALSADDATYAQLVYELTTLPAAPVLRFSTVWCAASLLLILGTPAARIQALATFTSPLAVVVEMGLWVFIWWTGGTLVYHTVHQLRLVSRLLTTHTRIDLFTLQPLYAFSGLTAVTAASLVLTAYAFTSVTPDALTGAGAPLYLTAALILVVLAVGTFVWPLWGVHRLLVAEKTRWQVALAQRLPATILDLQRRIDAGDLTGMDQLKDAIDAAVIAKKEVDAIPTWPWPPGTVRNLGGAALLPIRLWLICRLLERLLTL
jgi:hypothetical protein